VELKESVTEKEDSAFWGSQRNCSTTYDAEMLLLQTQSSVTDQTLVYIAIWVLSLVGKSLPNSIKTCSLIARYIFQFTTLKPHGL